MFHRGVPRAVRRELEYEVVGKPKPAPKPEQPTGSLGGGPDEDCMAAEGKLRLVHQGGCPGKGARLGTCQVCRLGGQIFK